MDPHTGRVLGMVSYPDFDLSYFDGGVISLSGWDKIREGNDPLYNRAISTKDSPGSIFKLVNLARRARGGQDHLDRTDLLPRLVYRNGLGRTPRAVGRQTSPSIRIRRSSRR